jgi:hypothetical protein
MELVRQHPYASAGVAVAAAGLIAVTPAAPPALDLQERAVQLTAALTSTLVDLPTLLLSLIP